MPITVNNNAPVQNQYIAEIMHIRAALDEALQQPGVPQATAAQIQQHMNAAEQEAKKEKPSPEMIRKNLDGAKALIEGLAAAVGLVPAFTAAADALRAFLVK